MTFRHTAGLIMLANLAAHQFTAEPDGLTWEEGEGLRFASLMDTSFQKNLFTFARLKSSNKLDPFLAEVDTNLVEITGDVRPHYHSNSDVVLHCHSADPRTDLVYTSAAGVEFWQTIRPGDLVVLPRGTVHGFHREGQSEIPFQLLDFGYPPLAEEDVTYVD